MSRMRVPDWLVVGSLAAIVPACQQGRRDSPAVEEVVVTPNGAGLALGRRTEFAALARYDDGRLVDVSDDVAWSSSANATATVDDAGMAWARAVGEVQIRAELPSAAMTGSAQLLCTPAELDAIEVTPAAPTLALGTGQQLTATGIFSDGSTSDLTGTVIWDTSAAGVASVSGAGYTTAVGVGVTTISATDSQTGIVGTVEVGATAAVLVALAITPTNPSIALGTAQSFTATGTFSDATVQDLTDAVTWSSSVPAIANVSNALGSAGRATAAAIGATTISAIHPGSGINDSTTLTVTAAALVSIAVTPTNPSIALGTTQPFVATGTFTDASVQDLTDSVTWASSAPATATISNAGGTEGLATSVAIGAATITATDPGSGIHGNTILTVTAAELVAIAVTPADPSIALGTAQAFTATGTFTDASVQDLTDSVTWASSVPATATVSNAPGTEGLATSVAIGGTTVTATEPGSGIQGSTTLTVTAAVLVSIAVTPAAPSIPLGTGQQFTATGTYSDASVQDLTAAVTWSSSATGVATVSNAGGSEGQATSVALGATTITATDPGSGVNGATTLTVTAAVLVSIAVTPMATEVGIGSTQQLTATGTYSDASQQDLTDQVTWSSDSPAAATVSNAGGSEGLVTGVGIGVATITGTDPGTSIQAAAVITVTVAGIALRGSSSVSEPSGVTTLTLATPVGTLADDVLIAAIAIRPDTATITPPAGWTLVRRSDNSGGAANSLAVYSRIATSSEPATHAFTFSSSTGSGGGLLAFREADAASPIDVEAGASTASGLGHPAPDVTTTVAGAMLVTAHGFSSSATWTPPAGMTEIVDVASLPPPDAVGIALSVNVELLGAAGATGARTATASGDSDTGNGISVALRPEP